MDKHHETKVIHIAHSDTSFNALTIMAPPIRETITNAIAPITIIMFLPLYDRVIVYVSVLVVNCDHTTLITSALVMSYSYVPTVREVLGCITVPSFLI